MTSEAMRGGYVFGPASLPPDELELPPELLEPASARVPLELPLLLPLELVPLLELLPELLPRPPLELAPELPPPEPLVLALLDPLDVAPLDPFDVLVPLLLPLPKPPVSGG